MRRLTTVGRGKLTAPDTTPTATLHRVGRVVSINRPDAYVDVTEQDVEVEFDGDPEYERLLELARGPLPELEDVPVDAEERQLTTDVTSVLHELAASGQMANADVVEAALAAVGTAHQQTMESIREVLVASGGNGGPDTLTLAALSVIDGFARRPADPAPVIHVHTPKQDLSVSVASPEIHPTFNVEAPPPADVHVDVHAQPVHVAPPEVTVNVPPAQVQAAAAPVVHVTVPDRQPPEKPRAVRVEYDEDGFKTFVPIPADES